MLLGDGKADEAAVHAKEAVKLEPESPASQYTLGLSAMARNDTTGAEQAFQEVLKINPRAAVASLQIARLRLARGETAGAVHAAKKYRASVPTTWKPRCCCRGACVRRGMCSARSGN